eukprot:8942053-Ditylum_brightwellii.AAC.1
MSFVMRRINDLRSSWTFERIGNIKWFIFGGIGGVGGLVCGWCAKGWTDFSRRAGERACSQSGGNDCHVLLFGWGGSFRHA